MRSVRRFQAVLAVFVASWIAGDSAANTLHLRPGDILVVDSDAPPGPIDNGQLFLVDPVTGTRTILSNFSDPSQCPPEESNCLGETPIGVAAQAGRQILVIDQNGGANRQGGLFRVAPTGSRKILSDFGDPTQGPQGVEPSGVAVEARGQILVVDGGAAQPGLLFRVHRVTGNREVLSDFSDPSQCSPEQSQCLGQEPFAVAVEANGKILVTDRHAGKLFRIHPVTGTRRVLVDFSDPNQCSPELCPQGTQPYGVAVEANGKILVVQRRPATGGGPLLRIDPATGGLSVVHLFSGENLTPVGVAVEATGDILVVTQHPAQAEGKGGNKLFRVDRVTGDAELLSDFENPAQGPLGALTYGVAVAPGDVPCRVF